MDKRIQNTYNVLQASMRELLGKNTWDNITVQSLCECAGVSRTTFYAHFEHKEDLLRMSLAAFEKAMLSDNNSRSLTGTGTFRFLPILLNHVNGNRRLFAITNSTVVGYPVAIEFKLLITRLVTAEIEDASDKYTMNEATQHFIAGGIYSALVQWSQHSEDNTHLSLLNNIDQTVKPLL